MEQKIIIVEATCSRPLQRAVKETLSEMNDRGWRLVNSNTIPADPGVPADIHGQTYAKNESREMIFEKP